MKQLTQLLDSAGHSDFRDARGPLQLTQRQAAGKFTRDEAEELILRLEEELESGSPSVVPATATAIDQKKSAQAKALTKVPSQLLASELQSRGWVVLEP
jgi:hypothetical protein